MPKKTREPFAAGGLDDPAKQFREFAAECLELGRDTTSPEKHRMYLEMARVWYQMARRWEKRLQPGRPSRRHQSFE
jgi:acid phosphatase class B